MENGLANQWNRQKIKKKAYAGRGPETIWEMSVKTFMRTFLPWIGDHYATDGIGGKRLLILGESQYGPDSNLYPDFTRKLIRDNALKKGDHKIYVKILRVVLGEDCGQSDEERADFWQRVAYYNFIQAMLEDQGDRPTPELWQAAHEPFLQTLREITPNVVIVLGKALRSNLPPLPDGISICEINHPSWPGWTYAEWHPIVSSAMHQAYHVVGASLSRVGQSS